MAIERVGNGLLKIGARHRPLRQTLQQHLALVEESGGAVAALEREVRDESLLQFRKLAVFGMALDGADRFSIKAHRGDDAGRARVAGAVRVIDDDSAAQALRGAAAELGAGHPEIFAQEIVHRQIVAHVGRVVRMAVDGDAQCRHASAPLSMADVTGRDWKRRPVASKMAFRSAGTTGIITTSAMPLGRSSGVSGGSTSISRSRSGKSNPLATRYC